MSSIELLTDAFGRIQELVRSTVSGLDEDALSHRVGGGANSIAWLVWHLTRVQDDHIADAAGIEQVWTEQGWAERFGLDLAVEDTGYGHTSEEVDAVRVGSPELLIDYHDAVYEQTIGYVEGLNDEDLDAVIDDAWDPPVTLAVRLVSIVGDDLEHVGQAAFVRGLLG